MTLEPRPTVPDRKFGGDRQVAGQQQGEQRRLHGANDCVPSSRLRAAYSATERQEKLMEPARTVTVAAAIERHADVAAAIERHADGNGLLQDPDELIRTLRGIIAEFAFDLDAATHLP